jgi:hypothetical protein
MKYSNYKLAKARLYMTEDDKKAFDEELKNGELTSATKSKLDSLIHHLQPSRLKKEKGRFGSKGLNRKEKKKKSFNEMIQKIINDQKSQEDSE